MNSKASQNPRPARLYFGAGACRTSIFNSWWLSEYKAAAASPPRPTLLVHNAVFCLEHEHEQCERACESLLDLSGLYIDNFQAVSRIKIITRLRAAKADTQPNAVSEFETVATFNMFSNMSRDIILRGEISISFEEPGRAFS
jgi:hypothetical protein